MVGIRTLINNRVASGKFYKLPYEKSYLILGHSHTECAYNDTIISNVINLSSGGECYFYTYFKLKKLLDENSNLKGVFVGYSNNVIAKDMDEWIWGDAYVSARYPKYSAFMDSDDIGLLVEKNPRKLMTSLPIATKKYIGFLLGKSNNIITDQAWGGYVFLEMDKTDSLIEAESALPQSPTENDISESNLRYLDKIVESCKSAGISLYLIRSPLHPKYRGLYNEELFTRITSQRYGDVPFLDFKNFELQNNEFGDLEHLNYKGARKYSLFFHDMLINGLLNAEDKQTMIDLTIKNYGNTNNSLIQD